MASLWHDATTGGASVEVWVVVPALLVLIKFAVGSMGPRFVMARQINPCVQVLQILSYYTVSYTLGLMKPSVSKQHASATFNVFFQVWAVLIVTMQDGARIGRPYRPKEMTLVDLLSSLWSANQLRTQAELYLKVPLWVIWTIHAFRIIWYFVSSDGADEASNDNMKLVSDYMALLPHTQHDASPYTMKGYNYLVDGEDRQEKKMERPRFRFQLVQTRPDELITVDKVWTWTRPDGGPDRLLGTLSDGDNRFKDVCLSFALYKMLRRRFHKLPMPEAEEPAIRQLVSEAILEEDTRGNYERAFRVTEVELSFLQDFSYSKHAVVFARGFPVIRLILSSCMAAAALYLAYAVRDIPSTSIATTTSGRVAKISHGVWVTHFLIFIVVCRELWEIGVYVLSQWTKVVIVCHYIRLKLRQEQGRTSKMRQLMVEVLARIMFRLVWKGQWNQEIQQHNLLMVTKRVSLSKLKTRRVKLRNEVKTKIFESLKALITPAPPPAAAAASSSAQQDKNEVLKSYLGNAFPGPHDGTNANANANAIEGIHGMLERDTHKILVWHVATSLCQIDLLEEAGLGDDLYELPTPSRSGGGAVWPHYNTAVTLSNYCVHLVKEALLPDNGLVASMILDVVCAEARNALRGCRTRRHIYDKLVEDQGASDGTNSILAIGTRLAMELRETYVVVGSSNTNRTDLWQRLGKFWLRYLLYLSAFTRVAKHRIHLQGRGQLTTHLWALLSHAGFLGEDTPTHGQQLLDPVDNWSRDIGGASYVL